MRKPQNQAAPIVAFADLRGIYFELPPGALADGGLDIGSDFEFGGFGVGTLEEFAGLAGLNGGLGNVDGKDWLAGQVDADGNPILDGSGSNKQGRFGGDPRRAFGRSGLVSLGIADDGSFSSDGKWYQRGGEYGEDGEWNPPVWSYTDSFNTIGVDFPIPPPGRNPAKGNPQQLPPPPKPKDEHPGGTPASTPVEPQRAQPGQPQAGPRTPNPMDERPSRGSVAFTRREREVLAQFDPHRHVSDGPEWGGGSRGRDRDRSGLSPAALDLLRSGGFTDPNPYGDGNGPPRSSGTMVAFSSLRRRGASDGPDWSY